jgi:Leucine Rich repeat
MIRYELSIRLLIFSFFMFSLWAPAPAGGQTPDGIVLRITEARSVYHENLRSLAAKCREGDREDLATEVENRIVVHRPDRQTIYLPPARAQRLATASSDGDAEISDEQLRFLGTEYAVKLLDLARESASGTSGATAYQLLHEALVADPDHAQIRKMLGFSLDEEHGWVQSPRAVRLRAVPAKKRQELANWSKDSYQVIESMHFTISSADPEAGVEAARYLERTYDVWRQVWFDYWCSAKQLREWMDGSASANASSRNHDVLLFRDHEHYQTGLSDIPGIGISTGYYVEDRRASFFYGGSPPPLDTWKHEIVHQLLQECGGIRKTVASYGHAPLVEGIAMYFESLRDYGHYATLGGFDSERLQYARLRWNRSEFHMPLEQLDSLDRDELLGLPEDEIRAVYSQSGGLTQYLFLGQEGKYRDGLIGFVKQLYQGRAKDDGLAAATAPFFQMDREYREFLEVQVRPLADLDLQFPPECLSLGKSGLQSDDLEPLSKLKRLEWLQLSGNPIDDEGMKHVAAIGEISSLMLDGTRITDRGLETVCRIRSLTDLDLAGTRITDAGLAHLRELKQLVHVDLRDTRVTAAGVESLKKDLPDLVIEQ